VLDKLRLFARELTSSAQRYTSNLTARLDLPVAADPNGGDLSDRVVAEQASRAAYETLQCIESMTYDECAGAVTQVVAGHVVRKSDAARWQRILEAASVGTSYGSRTDPARLARRRASR
jgi:hypothetical protein